MWKFCKKLNNKTFLSLHLLIYILLYIDFLLIIKLLTFLPNIYLVILLKFIIIINNTRFNKK